LAGERKVKIPVDRLVPGLFIDLERSWMNHPFLFSKFKLQSAQEIAIIKELGITEVTVIPDLSDTKLPEAGGTGEVVTQQSLWRQKHEGIDQASTYRSNRHRIAMRYQETVKQIKNLTTDLKSAPANAVRTAFDVAADMAKAFQKDSNVLINLVNLADQRFTMYNHTLNVTVLSLYLGSSLGLDQEQLRKLGLGSVMHDIGKSAVPAKVLMKREALNPSELKLLQSHTLLGSRMVQQIDTLPPEALAIIEQHHEFLDGSGYPRGLTAADISQMARIVGIANLYDNLCNPPDAKDAMTPKNAMALLFQKYKDRLDAQIVQRFIQTMGVYPPGTIVKLSDGSIGLVVAVDPKALLKPQVLLYSEDIPRNEAVMVDLRFFTNVTVVDVLKTGQCPDRVFSYLGIQERVGYFYDQRGA
jgi:putative nucleotidyltransferase with HDIG domain